MSGTLNTLTTEEAALSLGVTPSRVRQMIRAGKLPATRFGKAHLIFEKDLALVQERPLGRPPNAKTHVIATPNAIDITLKLNQSFREAKEADEASQKTTKKRSTKK